MSSNYHVCYQIQAQSRTSQLMDTTVALDSVEDVACPDIPGLIKAKLRPERSADPSDGYRGQRPDEIVIVAITNLDNL